MNPIHLDGGPMRTPAFEGGAYWVRFTAADPVVEVKDDANLVTITRSSAGVYVITFTGLYTAVLGLLGEPCIIAPTANVEGARVTALSNGTIQIPVTFELTAWYGGATLLWLSVMSALILFGYWAAIGGTGALRGVLTRIAD